jgi:hypothetical protein
LLAKGELAFQKALCSVELLISDSLNEIEIFKQFTSIDRVKEKVREVKLHRGTRVFNAAIKLPQIIAPPSDSTACEAGGRHG